MAAIYQWYPSGVFLYTTPPYTIENVDEINWTVSLQESYSLGVVIEDVHFSAGMQNGTLVDVYIASDVQSDDVHFSAGILDSTLVDIFLETGVHTDDIHFSAGVVSGEIALGVVRHLEQPAENIDFTPSFQSGSST